MIYVHDLSQYALGTKDEEEGARAGEERSEGGAPAGGTRQTVCAALVAHVHRHPVVLMLQDAASGEYRLPGGAVPAGEDEVVVLCRALDAALAPSAAAVAAGAVAPAWRGRVQPDRLLATYWRPRAARADAYPYLPVHVTTPAERVNVYLAELPERCALAAPRGARLVAVPFYDLYDSSPVFGTIPAALPILLSRFEFIYC